MYNQPTHLDDFNYINELIREETDAGIIKAANWCQEMTGQTKSKAIKTKEGAWRFLNQFWHGLLDSELYCEAATMNWGFDKFDARAYFPTKIFEHLPRYNKPLIMAASSSSKTYSLVAWLYLDYQRDPQYTSVKCLAVNGAMLQRNIFTHLYEMHESSVMDVSGSDASNLFLGDKVSNKDSGFEGITMPQDQKATGRLKGIKPKPRNGKPHPVFGKMSRVRIFIDEYQNVSAGMEKDFASPLSSIDGPHTVKLILSGNPEDESHSFGKLAEPVGGWREFDIENDVVWRSKRGYDVLRLDGAKCENVIHKENIYPGLLSWEGYQDHLLKGSNHPEYMTFARGSFPLAGSFNVLIPRTLYEKRVGDAMFHEGYTECAAVDIALRSDSVIFAYGKFGLATGYRDFSGEEVRFTTGTSDANKPRFILQVDQLIELTDFDQDPVDLAKKIIMTCRDMGVDGAHLALDATGMGEGVHSYIRQSFGNALGIRWGDDSSELRALKEDVKTAKELYYRKASELWYTTHKWMTAGAMLFSKRINNDKLIDQLTTRRKGKPIGSRERVESKDEYKLRNLGNSPDEADAVVMLQQIVRERSSYLPSISGDDEILNSRTGFKPKSADTIDSLKFDSLTNEKALEYSRSQKFDINKLKTIHTVDTL